MKLTNLEYVLSCMLLGIFSGTIGGLVNSIWFAIGLYTLFWTVLTMVRKDN